MKKNISVLQNMARAGGTLISKCIGCMENTVLLSEVHPFVAAEHFNPLKQAEIWFGFELSEKIRAKAVEGRLSWLDGVEIIWDYASERELSLVIRDWSHIDYTGVPWVKPTYQSTTTQVLGQRFNLSRSITVRHPVDQWLSLSKLGLIAGKITVQDFMLGYHEFSKEAARIGFVRYEDFTRDPELNLKIICDQLSIKYDEQFTEKWHSYSTITGDVGAQSASRAKGMKKISPLRRPEIDPRVLEEFKRSDGYSASLSLLGYVD